MASIANTIVRTWEQVQASAGWQRPAVLLAALSGIPLTEAISLGVAHRDAALLSWRAALFGPRWLAFARCPRCEAMLEYELPVGSEAFTPPSDPTEIEFEGRKWLVRWPDSRDLADAAACQDRGLARSILISRILPVDVDEASVPPILAALSAAHRSFWSMELHCCACPHSWNVVFDAGEFLWREVRAAARRILREVDVLSRVYHWSEDEILAMSEIRRSSYLEMVQ